MALVDNGQEIVGKVIQQAEWAHAGSASVEVARIVLNARAVAHLAHHFHVIGHALIQSLGLGKAVLAGESGHLGLTIQVDLAHGGTHAFLGSHEDVGRENFKTVDILGGQLSLAIKNLDTLNLIAPEDETQHDVLVAQEHVDCITLDTESAHPQLGVAA